MEVSPPKLLDLLVSYFTYEEIRNFSLRLGVDFDEIRGETKSAKAREIIVYSERQGLLDEFVQLILYSKPELSDELTPQIVSEPLHQKEDANVLTIELAGLRQQLDELKKEILTGKQIEEHLESILKTANRAIGRSEELSARLILPRKEDTDVYNESQKLDHMRSKK